MVSKHLFIIFSSIVIAQSTQAMDIEDKGTVTIQMSQEKPHETLARHACAILKVNDKKSEDAIRSLLKGSSNESSERKQERNSLLKKISDSLELELK